ncbi:MAG: alpha/beta hydrolase [Deltaproteobacteria bacterium]|nr:alpha/beta hydrolase [Deltaproteobacteria bacterium]
MFPKVPLVFIHGFKGAGLKNESGAVWLTPWQALGLSTPQLALPLRWNGDVQQPDEITADEVLSRVRVVPFLFGEDIYGPWLEAAAEFNRPFYTFAYDWRRDNLETLEKFEKFIEDVCTRDGVAKVQVVAHSMGGLVAMALLNKRPEIFHDVIFVGVPFTGGVGFLEDLHAGVLTGLNSRILSPPVLFTFPSVYALFPLDGVGLEDRQGKPVKMDFYSAAAWRRNGLAVFWKPSADANAQEKFLQKALEHAKKFRLLLQPHAAKYPTVTVVLGKTLPTIVAARRTDVESKRGWDLDASTRQPGDGRVAAQHAVPPKGIEYRTFDSKAGHANLLSDPEVIGLIRDSVK